MDLCLWFVSFYRKEHCDCNDRLRGFVLKAVLFYSVVLPTSLGRFADELFNYDRRDAAESRTMILVDDERAEYLINSFSSFNNGEAGIREERWERHQR